MLPEWYVAPRVKNQVRNEKAIIRPTMDRYYQIPVVHRAVEGSATFELQSKGTGTDTQFHDHHYRQIKDMISGD
jgi:hypothetical protein